MEKANMQEMYTASYVEELEMDLLNTKTENQIFTKQVHLHHSGGH